MNEWTSIFEDMPGLSKAVIVKTFDGKESKAIYTYEDGSFSFISSEEGNAPLVQMFIESWKYDTQSD